MRGGAASSLRAGRATALAVLALSVAACGGAAAVASAPVASNPPVSLPAPSIAPPTTTEPPSTTAEPTTTTVALPEPVPSPRDPYGPEPRQVLGTIDIPKLGLHAEVAEGVRLTTLDQGPGHWPGTALPGQRGNVVVAGHRVTHSHPFRDIDRLVVGDLVVFTFGGQPTTYAVTGHDVVTPQTMSIVAQTDAATATLFACHPPHSAAYRYVVHLRLVTS